MKKLMVLSVFAALAIACGGNDNKPPTDPSGSTNTTNTPAPSTSGAPSTPTTPDPATATSGAPGTPPAKK